MIGEIVVFGGQNGADEVGRDVLETNRAAAHFTEFGDQFAIAAVYPEGDLQLDAAQRLDGRQAGAKIEISSAQAEEQPTKNGKRRPAEKLQQTHQDLWISR